MSLSKIISCVVYLGFFLSLSHEIYAARKISHEEISRFFKKDHPLLKDQSLSIDIENAKSAHLMRSFYPELSIVAGWESYASSVLKNNDSGYLGSELKLNLYSGGRDKLEEAINTIDSKLARLSYEEKKHHLHIDALQVFWSIALGIEQLNFIEDLKISLNELQKSLKVKIKSGVVTQTELDALHLSLKEFEFLGQKINLEIRNQTMLFAYLLGLDVDDSISLAIDYHKVWQRPVNASLSAESHKSEKIKSLDLLVEKHELDRQLATRSWRPKLDVYAGYGISAYKEREYADSADRLEGEFGIRVSVPVSDFMTQQPNIKAHSVKAKYAAAKRDQLARQIGLKEHQLRLSYTQKRAMLKAAESLSEAQFDLHKKRLSEYQRGLRSAVEITESLRAMQRSKFEMLSLKKDLFLIADCFSFSEGVHACKAF